MRSSWPPRMGPLGWGTETLEGALGFLRAVDVNWRGSVSRVTGGWTVGVLLFGKFCNTCSNLNHSISQSGLCLTALIFCKTLSFPPCSWVGVDSARQQCCSYFLDSAKKGEVNSVHLIHVLMDNITSGSNEVLKLPLAWWGNKVYYQWALRNQPTRLSKLVFVIAQVRMLGMPFESLFWPLYENESLLIM